MLHECAGHYLGAGGHSEGPKTEGPPAAEVTGPAVPEGGFRGEPGRACLLGVGGSRWRRARQARRLLPRPGRRRHVWGT